MPFERAEYLNWCQHRHQVIEFAPGTNLITGRNGSGKSNLLTGLVYLLTGDASRNDGKKEKNINWHAPEDEPAGVRGVYRHGHVRLHISRMLRGTGKNVTSLEVFDLDGRVVQPRITGDGKVTAAICNLLNTTPKFITTYGIVAQGDLFRPFSAEVDKEERLSAFQRLFGIDQAETAWKKLGEKISSRLVHTLPDTSAAEGELQTVNASLAVLESEYAKVQDFVTWSEAGDPATQVVARYNAAEAARGLQESARRQRGQSVLTLLSLLNDLDREEAAKVTLEYTIRQAETGLAEAQRLVAAKDRASGVAAARAQLESRKLAAMQRQSALGAPPPLPPVGGQPEDFEQTIRELSVQDAADANFVAAFDAAGTSVCPTCHRTIDEDVTAQIEAARQRRLTTRDALREAAAAKARAEQMLQQHRSYQDAQTAASNEIASVTASIAGLGMPGAEDATRWDAAKTFLADVQGLLNEQTRVQATLAGIYNQANAVYQVLLSQRQQVVQCRYALRNVPATHEAVAADQWLNQARANAAAAQRLSVEIQAKRGRQAVLQGQIDAAKAMARTMETQVKVRDRLQAIRDVLHREEAPQRIIERRLAELIHPTEVELGHFGRPFRLKAAPEATYTAVFPDSVESTLTRLSGGQKSIFGLSFRSALNLRFARDLGFLGLDEPTAWLDKEHVQAMQEALLMLHVSAKSKGIQIIVITHEPFAGFDNAISL